MIKKICFSILIVLMLAFISINIYEYDGTLQVSQNTNEESLPREKLIPFNFAEFRSFDLIVVIIVISTATTGISSILSVKRR